MPKKKPKLDLCSLADGEFIREIAWYQGKEAHNALKDEMGRHWFNKEVIAPFALTYSTEKAIGVIDYAGMTGCTNQCFGIGDTPEQAVANALSKIVAMKPLVKIAEGIVKKIS
jgi:hypothetical protein